MKVPPSEFGVDADDLPVGLVMRSTDGCDYVVTHTHTWELYKEPIYRKISTVNNNQYVSWDPIDEDILEDVFDVNNTFVIKHPGSGFSIVEDLGSVSPRKITPLHEVVPRDKPVLQLADHLFTFREPVRPPPPPASAPPRRRVGRPRKSEPPPPKNRVTVTAYNEFMREAMQKLRGSTMSSKAKMQRVAELWRAHKEKEGGATN